MILSIAASFLSSFSLVDELFTGCTNDSNFNPNLLSSFSLKSTGKSSILELFNTSTTKALIALMNVWSNLHKSINPYKEIILSIGRIFSTNNF